MADSTRSDDAAALPGDTPQRGTQAGDDRGVNGITDEMVEAAAARLRVWQPSLTLPMSSSAENIVRDLLDAALAGREVVDLPEPDGERNQQPAWQGPADYGTIIATVWSGKLFDDEPYVHAPDHVHNADEAEELGAKLIAAARRSRLMAAERKAARVSAGGGVL